MESTTGRPEAADGTIRFSQEREEVFMTALGDSTSRRILLTLDAAPHPVHDLVRILDLPQSTVYHKLHELERAGLVTIQSVTITPEGRRVELYRSLLEGARIEMNAGKLTVRVKLRNLAAERLGNMWQMVRKEVNR